MPITVRCREEGYDCRTETYCPGEQAAKKKTVDRSKIIAALKEIDLYRAKYRHSDMTPYGWCFHGDRAQGWEGQAVNHRLVIKDGTRKIQDIDADTYKYVSFDIEVPSFWLYERLVPTGITTKPCSDYYEPPYYVKPIPCTDKITAPKTPVPDNLYQAYTDSGYSTSIDTTKLDALRTGITTQPVSGTCSTNIRCAACDIGEYGKIGFDDIIITGPVVEPTPIRVYQPPEITETYRKELYEDVMPAGYSYELKLTYYKVAEATEELGDGNSITRKTITSYYKTLNLGKGSNFRVIDMSAESDWSGTISKIELSISLKLNGTSVPLTVNGKKVHPIIFLEYFKVDSINLAEEVNDDYGVTSIDINALRSAIDTINKAPVDWSKKGSADDRVKNFLSIIKRKDFDELLTTTRSVAPYNGCATCDTFTCQCYAIADGHVACTPCNACNSFQACQSCDVTCFTEARTKCSCNQSCYTQARQCTCNGVCYAYRASCTCNAARY